MGLIDALLGREVARSLGVKVSDGVAVPRTPLYPADPSQVWVGDRSALSVPAVMSAIDLIAGTVAATPFAARMVDNTLLVPQPVIVVRPDPGQNRVEWLYELVFNYLLRGEAFVRLYAKDANGYPRAMAVLENDDCDVIREDGRRWVTWQGKKYGPDEIKHLWMFRLPGEDRGYGPIQLARTRLAGDIANAEFSRRLFTDGGVVTSVLKHPNSLDATEAAALKAAWINAMAGTREPAVLSGGIDFDTVTPNLVDLTLLDLRKEGVLDVARMFKVPPTLLAAEMGGSSLTYQNVVQVWQQFTKMQMPLFAKIESAWSMTIPPDAYIYADLDAWLRPDPAGQLDAVIAGVTAGLFTLEEGRKRLGLPPMPTDEPGVRTVSPTAGGQ